MDEQPHNPNSFIIGGAEILVEATPDGTITLLPQGALGHGTNTGGISDSNDEVTPAMKLVAWAITNTYDAKVLATKGDDSAVYMAVPQQSSMGEFIAGGREVLNVDKLMTLMGKLEKRFQSRESVQKVLAKIDADATQTKAARADASSQASSDDQRAAIMNHDLARRAIIHLASEMEAIREVLTLADVEMDRERAETVAIALRDTQTQMLAQTKAEPRLAAEAYAVATIDAIKRSNIELQTNSDLENQLRMELTQALTLVLQNKRAGGRGQSDTGSAA
jgi:hypothetical protein